MPLKNKSNRARKHPSFNRASNAQRLRRIEEKRSAYIDSSFENNTIAPINEPDLFTRCDKAAQTDLGGICYLTYSEFESKFKKCEVAVQTDPSEDIVHEVVVLQNNSMSEAKSLTSLRTPQNALTAEEMSDLPDLCIETSIDCTENCLPGGNFLCNLSHMIAQVRQLELHSYSCNFGGTYVFNKMIKCGSGFSQEEEKFSVMNVRYMSKDKFASCEKLTSEVMKSYAEEEMLKAILDEKQLAESRGDIDSDGYYCITLIVDGGWCKRSYGHGYNASSGVSVLIGMSTQKIVFIGVRNKVCLICCAVANGRMEKKDHLCWKNWKGPSTAMESDCIVEGLLYLETVHHIRCTRLVGDGDSNTIAKCREKISYGGRILKVECANHAVRRYGRAIQKLQGNTTRFSGPTGIKGRQLLKQKLMKLVKGARNAIKSNAINNHNQPLKEAVSKLISDLRNVPNHVFGKHENCGIFCKRNIETDNTIIL
ncbi:yqaJ domain-containing protein [Trichonephila clavata]|uniref:YqaJ domain-containing protein n=1 Tax=Trichonephila clavata TaxID=2740835 RepID=A0A8X6K9U0_TRICU|nr:yqaJ domain-containing protein [Trichonephila clavata]